jgi:hypothetical protein
VIAAPNAAKYLDGWQDACNHLRRELAADDTHCPSCAVDRVKFAGIAAAALADATAAKVRPAVVASAAEALILTAMSPTVEEQARLIGESRAVATEPEVAAEVMTQLALLLAKHYGEADDAATWTVPASEWG